MHGVRVRASRARWPSLRVSNDPVDDAVPELRRAPLHAIDHGFDVKIGMIGSAGLDRRQAASITSIERKKCSAAWPDATPGVNGSIILHRDGEAPAEARTRAQRLDLTGSFWPDPWHS